MEMFTKLTKGEDGAVIENIQRNIRNPRFQVGPITQSYERAISNFHDAYLEFVK
jgi:phenylpropionate dioxygenase-like ring-hydroxylating dioxygenase large terminal subunit